ncbi:MAG: VCBS repeat-containing protein [bacterium]|nr:VCBS repeat-containing protein [bacterium]
MRVDKFGTGLRQIMSIISSFLTLTVIFMVMLTTSVGAAEIVLSHPSALPGENISFTGHSFWSNETVSVSVSLIQADGSLGRVERLPESSTDADGKFSVVWTVPEDSPNLSEVNFNAIGASSGLTATASLSATNTTIEFVQPFPAEICRDTIGLTETILFCAQLSQRCPNAQTTPLVGRKMQFFISDGNCGANVGQVPFASTLTDQDGNACLEITGLDLIGFGQQLSVRAKFDGEAPPADGSFNSACDPNVAVYLSVSNSCESSQLIEGCITDEVDFEVVAGDSADLYFVRTVDIDRDNYKDVIYTGKETAGLFIAYGNSSGTLNAPVSYISISQDAFSFGYVNPDTLMDIIAVRGNTVYILTNLGARQFQTDSIMVLNSTPVSRADSGLVPSITTGYFDTDPYLDIVVGPNTLLKGATGGTSFSESTLPFTVLASERCDLDNSGSADLVVVGQSSIAAFLNDGTGLFTPAFSFNVPEVSFQVPPSIGVTDFNRDGNCDFAVVLPATDTSSVSILWVFHGDGNGGTLSNNSHLIDGLAFNLVTTDVNRDNITDLTVANGTARSLNIFYGDSLGNFGPAQDLNLGTGSDETYTLAALDVDRDGNTDFVSGGLGGGNLIISISQEPDQPVLADEMVVFGFSNLDVAVKNPDGHEITEEYSTVAGSDYQELDMNSDGLLDERTIDYNLMYGEYEITLYLEPDAGDEPTYAGVIGIDGSQQAVMFKDYNAGGFAKADTIFQPDSITFYFTMEEVSSISPPNGAVVSLSRPHFDWAIHASSVTGPFHFELDRYYDFRNPIFDTSGLVSPDFLPNKQLNDDSVYYWRYRSFDGASWSEYSRTFAVYVTDVCCDGSSGNVDGDPTNEVDINDITYLAGYLFSGNEAPGDPPGCAGAGNVDGEGIVNIADVTALVEYLFSDGDEPALCP